MLNMEIMPERGWVIDIGVSAYMAVFKGSVRKFKILKEDFFLSLWFCRNWLRSKMSKIVMI